MQFGDTVYYISPQNGNKTKCIFIRDDDGKAVVMFENAEFAARVLYKQLSNSPLRFVVGNKYCFIGDGLRMTGKLFNVMKIKDKYRLTFTTDEVVFYIITDDQVVCEVCE